MKWAPQICVVLMLAMLALLLTASLLAPDSARAHARFLGSKPPAGSTVAVAPREIEITLSEAVSLDFSAIRVLERSRAELPLGTIGHGAQGEASVRVAVNGTLPPGTYGVVWRVVSAVDGHLTSGSFVFRVLKPGESPQATPEPVLGATSTTDPDLAGGEQRTNLLHLLARALVLACITFCVGGAIFLVLVVEPSAAERGVAGATLWPLLGSRFAKHGTIVAASMVPLLAFDLWAQVAAISQTDLPGALGRADLAALLLSATRYGFAWTMKMLAAVVLFGLLLIVVVRRKGGSGLWEIAIATGSLFLLAEALSSHAAAVQGENVAGLPLPVVSDWVHLVTASTWIGGLLFFLAVLFPAYQRAGLEWGERRAFLAAAVPRFSRLALASVLALGISGTYNLAIQTTDIPAIASSLYGQVVALKVVLFVALVLIGALNLVHLSPGLRLSAGSAGEGTVSHFRRNVRLEVILLAVVILCAGGLTLLPPPGDATPQRPPSQEASGGLTIPTAAASIPTPANIPSSHPVVATTATARMSVSLSVEQAQAGEAITVTLSPATSAGLVLTDVTRLGLTVSPQGLEAGSTAVPMGLTQPSGREQVWVGSGSVLAFAGDYLVTVVAQRSSTRDMRAAFWLTLPGEGGLTLRAIEYLEARFSTVPEPPIVGSNRIVVDLRGAEGEPVGEVRAMLEAIGPQGRRSGSETPLQPLPGGLGKYFNEVDLPETGAWTLKVTASRSGQPQLKFTASIDVQDTPTRQP